MEQRQLLSLTQIIDNGDQQHYAEAGGNWSSWTDAGAYQGNFRYHAAGDGSQKATWTFDSLESGKTYQAFATWKAEGNRATNAPFTVLDNTTALATVRVNQQIAPLDTTVDGTHWQSLGTYTIQSDTLSVSLSADANNYVIADAVRIVEIPAVTTLPSMLDDGDAAFSQTGEDWYHWAHTDAQNGDIRYHAAGTGANSVTWSFQALDPGKHYQVYATWSAQSNRATNSPFTVLDGTTALATVQLNQQFAPDDAAIGGQPWESLGVYQAAGGTLNIELTDNANGYVIADAVRVVDLTPLSSVIDDGDAAYAESGSGWSGYDQKPTYQGDFRYHSAGTGQNAATWTFESLDASKQYRVYATWSAWINRATNSPFTVLDDTTTLATVRINQQFAPDEVTYEDFGWDSLGVYQVTSGRLTVQLTDDADGDVIADAVRIVEVSPATPLTAIDDGDAAYAEDGGNWLGWSEAGAYQGDFRYHAAGTGQNAATWTFEAIDPAKHYQVLTTWSAQSNRATNSPYTILDDTAALGTIRINQQFAPVDKTVDGQGWQSLGVYQADSGTLNIKLTDDANGYVIADGVRIVEVQPVTTPPSVVDNGDSAYAETGNDWLGWSETGAYQTDFRYHTAGTGENAATWSVVALDPSKYYQVYVTYSPQSNRATNSPFTVLDDETVLSTVRLNQQSAPNDTFIDGQGWEGLGVFQTSSGTLTVKLTDDVSSGYIVADAIRVVEAPGPAAISIVTDNGDDGYAESGSNWVSGSDSSAYQGDFRYHAAGSGQNKATWAFSDLPTAVYEVYVTWTANSDRATNAPFTVYNGSTVAGTERVNQRLAPSGEEGGGWVWQSVGSYLIDTGELTVEMSDDANGVVVADAVRIIDPPQPLYWDTNGSAPGFGNGNGTWDTTTAMWNPRYDGTGTLQTWPTSRGTAYFAGSGGGTVTISGSVEAWSMSFGVSGYTIQSGSLTTSSWGMSIGVASGMTATISSQITGSYAVSKTNSGTLVISGSNSYTGATTVSAGVLRIENDSALGNSGYGTTVSSGAVLQLAGGLTNVAEPLTLNGTGISNGGALQNYSDTNVISGAITLNSASGINSNDGTLTINGNLSGSGKALTVGGNGNTTIAGTIGTGSGTLTKDGDGILTLTGTNTYTGGTTISAGTLQVGNNTTTGTLGSGSGTVVIEEDATLMFNRSDTVTIANPISGLGGVTNYGPYGSRLIFTGGKTYTGGTTLGNWSTLQIGNGSTSGSIIGEVNGYGYLEFNCSEGVEFGGTFVGGVNVVVAADSILRVGNDNALPNGVDCNGPLSVEGTLDLNGYSPTVGYLEGSGTITTSSTGTGTLYFYNANFSGDIEDGSGTVAMSTTTYGGGTLNGENSYSGGTTVNSGILSITQPWTDYGSLTVIGSGTLEWGETHLHGLCKPVSSTELSLTWFNYGGDEGTTHAYEVSIDGVNYWPITTGTDDDASLTLSGLQPNTAYQLRMVATHTDGNQQIYNGGMVQTSALSETSGWYKVESIVAVDAIPSLSLLPGDPLIPNSGSTAYESTAILPQTTAEAIGAVESRAFVSGADGQSPEGSFIEDNSWVYADSPQGAVLQSVLGLVTDGSVPQIDENGNATLYWIFEGHDMGGGQIVPYEGYPMYSFDQDGMPPDGAYSTPVRQTIPFTINLFPGLSPPPSNSECNCGSKKGGGSPGSGSPGKPSGSSGGSKMPMDAIDNTGGCSTCGINSLTNSRNNTGGCTTCGIAVSGLTYGSREISSDTGFGPGWSDSDELPLMLIARNTLAVRMGTEQSLWFDDQGEDTYVARYDAQETLVHDAVNDLFILTMSDGTRYEFFDDVQDDITIQHPQGGLFRSVAPGGATIEVTGWTESGFDGRIAEVQYKTTETGQAYQKRVFTYVTTDDGLDHVETLILSEYNGASWSGVRKITYDYYDNGESYGAPGDLKTILTQQWNGATWTGDDTNYFRYYTDAGREHLLRRVLVPNAYAGFVSLYGDPANPANPNAGDSQTDPLSNYTCFYYEYDAARRVTKKIVFGKSDTSDFAATLSGKPRDMNNWYRKSVETRLDGSTTTVYTNYVGAVLLSDLSDGTNHWITYNRYDDAGRLVLTVQPSAFELYGDKFYDDTLPDLVDYVSGNSPYLKDTDTSSEDGLFEITTYYEDTSAGIDEDTAGGVEDYLHQTALAHGETMARTEIGQSGGPILQKSYEYYARTVEDQTIYPIASTTTYSNEDGTGAATTIYAYTWYSDTFQIQEETTTLPLVSTDQNGSGNLVTSQQWFDTQGNLQWTLDERGRVNYYYYDPLTNRQDYMIQDVKSGILTPPTTDYTGNSDGLHLQTDYQYDALGRITRTLGPAHTVDLGGTATSVRTAVWAVYKDAVHETWSALGYVLAASPTTATIVNPISITKTDRDGRVTDQIQAAWGTSTAHAGTLDDCIADCPALDDADLHFTSWTANKYANTRLAFTAVYYVIPSISGFATTLRNAGAFLGTSTANYNLTTIGYENFGVSTNKGRQDKTIAPDGTIIRNVLDSRGNVVEIWMGTNDSFATDAVPDGSAFDGTLHDAVSWSSDHPFASGGNACSLDFGDSYNYGYVEVEHQNEFDASAALTIALWVKFDEGYQCYPCLFDTCNVSGENGCQLRAIPQWNSGLSQYTYQLEWKVSGLMVDEYYSSLTSLGTLTTDIWHHVAVQYNPATGKLRIFIDGNLDNEAIYTGSPQLGINPLILGNYANKSYYGLQGNMDDVRFYRQISDTQIGMFYSQGQPTASDFPQASAHWRFEENSGSMTSGAGYQTNNMVRISGATYGVNGKLIQSRAYFDDGPSDYYAINYQYDWHDRLIYSINPSDDQGRVTYTMYCYDNYGHNVKTQPYWDDDYDIATSGPEPFINDITPGDDKLLSQEITSYDALERVYRTCVYAVDVTQTDPIPGSAIISNTWYDDAGNVIKQQASGSKTFIKTLYDGLGRTAIRYIGYDIDEDRYYDNTNAETLSRSIVSIDGNVSVAGDTILAQVEYSYDTAGNMTSGIQRQRCANDNSTGDLANVTGTYAPRNTYNLYWYDGIGRLTAMANYGALETVPTRQETPPPSSDTVLVTSTAYDEAGRTESTTDPLDHVSKTFYDDAGRVIRTVQNFIGTGDYNPDYPDQNININRSYTANGKFWKITDTLGYVTEYIYDDWGRLHERIDPDPDPSASSDVPHTFYSYNRLGELTSLTDPLGQITTYEYDYLGRQKKVTQPDPDGPGGSDAPYTVTVYDVRGNVYSTADRLGNTSYYEYDEWNRLATETNANGSVTRYTYDDFGRSASLKDPANNTTAWTYDELNRLVTETNQLSATRHYTYSGGLLMRIVDRNGRVRDFEYDRFGQMEYEFWYENEMEANADPDHEYADRTFTFAYDRLGNLSSAVDPDATYVFEYDALGRATEITQTLAGLSSSVQFTQQYYGNGNRKQLAASFVSSSDDFVNDYLYDHLGRMTQFSQHGVTLGNAVSEKRVNFTYDVAGQWDTIIRYADLAGTDQVATGTYAYDFTGRLTDLTYAQPNSSTLPGYHWTWNQDNRITNLYSRWDTLSGLIPADYATWANATYSNDDTGQLTDAVYANWQNTPGPEDYNYDANGNRINNGFTVAATDNNNQMLTGAGYHYTYDLEGNRELRFVDTDDDGFDADDIYITRYTWDHLNRLTKVEDFDTYAHYFAGISNQIVEYAYDYQNRLILRTLDPDGSSSSNGTIHQTAFVYDRSQIVLQFDQDGTDPITPSHLSHRYLWGPAVDQILADETADDGGPEDVFWTLTDQLNTVRDIAIYDPGTDETTIATHRVFDAFGRQTYETPSTPDCLFGFTAKLFDVDTGLQNNISRWYEPSSGKWISEDTIGLNGMDNNLYRYVYNDPLYFVDPYGYSCSKQTLKMEANPDWLKSLMKFLLVGDLKWSMVYKISTEICDVCCDDCWKSIKASANFSVEATMEATSGKLSLEYVTIKYGIFLTSKVGGSINMKYDGCTNSFSGGGCLSLGMDIGITGSAEVDTDHWIDFGGGVKVGLNVTTKICCDSTANGLNCTFDVCGSVFGKWWAWVQFDSWFGGWKWSYEEEISWGGCLSDITGGPGQLGTITLF